MTARDFVFWLQGYFEVDAELGDGDPELTPKQVACIKRHLALVFAHDVDPAIDGGDPAKKAKLDAVHGSRPPTNSPDKDIVYRC